MRVELAFLRAAIWILILLSTPLAIFLYRRRSDREQEESDRRILSSRRRRTEPPAPSDTPSESHRSAKRTEKAASGTDIDE